MAGQSSSLKRPTVSQTVSSCFYNLILCFVSIDNNVVFSLAKSSHGMLLGQIKMNC